MPDATRSTAFSSLDYATCSAALTAGLADSGARALAVALVTKSSPKLAGASAGAAVAFTDLCIALAEAPGDAQMRQIDVAGMGQVSWKAARLEDGETELLLFALHDSGRRETWKVSSLDAALGF